MSGGGFARSGVDPKRFDRSGVHLLPDFIRPYVVLSGFLPVETCNLATGFYNAVSWQWCQEPGSEGCKQA